MLTLSVLNQGRSSSNSWKKFSFIINGISLITARTIKTNNVKNLCYNKKYNKYKMSVNTEGKIRVYLQKDMDSPFEPGDFIQCIVDYIDPSNTSGTTQVTANLHDNRLHISPASTLGHGAVKIKHPPFCPIHHLSGAERQDLPKETLIRGIDCGVAVILETGDGKILLTKRADHMRSFPSIWVPPGGHIERNETFTEAGLRELQEETGLHITKDMCCHDKVQVLALWESVYPPKLSLGQPKRHHAVTYLFAKLKNEVTSEVLQSKIFIDPSEVGACAWFDSSKIKLIVSAKEDEMDVKSKGQTSEKTFRALVLTENKEQVESQLPFNDLLKTAGDGKDQKGRVSTGTKFALEEWLLLKKES